MERLKKYTLTFALLLISSLLSGQINGNGNITMKSFDFTGIEVIEFRVTVDAEIDLSADNDLYVEVDENIFEHLTIKMSGNKLLIDQNSWVEPSQAIKLKLGTTQLHRIRNTAWGHVELLNMDQERFRADMQVGTLIIKGKVGTLDARTGAGRIDASKLEAQAASVRIDENGQILVNASEAIQYGGSGFGRVVYLGDAQLERAKSASSELTAIGFEEEMELRAQEKAVQYVEVKLKNNSGKKKQLRFRGPVAKPFGYGAPIARRAVKTETFPVGTRIYEDVTIGKDKLLLIITEENAGQVLNLFAEGK